MMVGAAISWKSRQQNLVSLSSMESEYIALCESTQEVIWLRKLLVDLGVQQEGSTRMFEDNQSCIAFVQADRVNGRSKHIDTKQKFVKDLCEKGIIQLEYLCTENMIADILTKPLGHIKTLKFARQMGLIEK